MRRFVSKRRRPLAGLLLPAAATLVIIAFAAWGADSVSEAAREEQLGAVRRSVTRAAVHCYAIEGSYPPSLDFLEEHYGLTVDRARYSIHYHCFASNLMPEIDVIPLTK